MPEILSGGLRPSRLKVVFISLVLLIAIYPIFERGGIGSKLLNVFASVVLLSGVYIASSERRRFAIAIVLGVSAFVANWAYTFAEIQPLALAALTLATLFYLFTAMTILSYIMRAEKITLDLIYGAVSVYLLLGVAWSGAYAFLEMVHPGSFLAAYTDDPDNILNMSDFLYYSFVTLTTLGYGDITPVTRQARSLAILEAITGVFYIAVLVARLVGTHIAQSGTSSQDRQR